jgi:hypothetical protein
MLTILAYHGQYKVQHVFIIASGTFFLVQLIVKGNSGVNKYSR